MMQICSDHNQMTPTWLGAFEDRPFHPLHLSPGEHAYFQGDRPKGVYEIVSGAMMLYKLLPDGRRQVQDFASQGDYLSLTFAERHALSAEALADVEIRFLSRQAFADAFMQDDRFRRDMFTLVSAKLQASREQALLLGRKSAKERTASFLLFLEKRFKEASSGFVSIPMSRADIADYLGLTLETVSRMLNALKKKGIIDLPHPSKFRVCDYDRLVAAAGDEDVHNIRYAA